MSPTCYTTRATEPFALEGGKILPLRHDLFDNDAIVLQDMCKAITLKSKKSSKEVRLEYPDMNYLGLWHAPKTQAPYICIEPWCNAPDFVDADHRIDHKPGFMRLEKGQTITRRHTITLG